MKEFLNQIAIFLSNIPTFVWVTVIVLLLIFAVIDIIVIIKMKKLLKKARNSRIVGLTKRKLLNKCSDAIEIIEAEVYEHKPKKKKSQNPE